MVDVFRLICLGAFMLSLMGCVATTDATALVQESEVTRAAEPILRPGDRIQLTVFGEDKLTGGYDVDSAGRIAIPLMGSVQAEGSSPSKLEAAVALLLRQKYIRNPRVTIVVASLRPFYILGEVEKPGEYPFKTGLNLWRALAIAGGQTYRASASSIFIQHAGEHDMTEYDLSRDVSVQPGDLIRVPERWF